jgi:SAM-dependent methyltransferase
MKVFDNYSKYYNLLYKEKDYQSECDYIDQLIRKNSKNGRTLLDIGCGTGRHANELLKKGYDVCGVDVSKTMLNEAKENFGNKINFSEGDARNFNLDKKFDIITSLFHVMSYMTTNDDLSAAFKTAEQHLNDEGYFIFDCWYGPGVLNSPPSVRVKRMSDKDVEVIRIAEPVVHYNNSVVDVNFEILINDINTKELSKLSEVHPMRFLFKNEIELLAQRNNMEMVGFHSWLTFKEPTKEDWYAVFILKKTK